MLKRTLLINVSTQHKLGKNLKCGVIQARFQLATFCCDVDLVVLISSSSEFKRSGGGGGRFSMDPRGVVELDPSFPDPLVRISVSTILN